MPHPLFKFLSEKNDVRTERVCLTLIAEDFSVIRDFGQLKRNQSETDPFREYHPTMNPVSEIRIDGKIYFDAHSFGDLKLSVHRFVNTQGGRFVGNGQLNFTDCLRFHWQENEDKLDDWVATLQMFDPKKKNLTFLIFVNPANHKCTHIMNQVGSSSFAEEVLKKAT